MISNERVLELWYETAQGNNYTFSQEAMTLHFASVIENDALEQAAQKFEQGQSASAHGAWIARRLREMKHEPPR